MNHELPIAVQIAILAIQIAVILFAARIFGNLAQKLKVPSVLGELIAGIVIGPYVLGAIGIPLHGFEHGLFALPAGTGLPVSTPLYALATLGSIVLLFLSGLETDLRMFFRYSVVGTVVGLGGVIFSFGLGDLLGVWMFKCSFMDPRCLFLGILCTATSVGITARILSEKKAIDSPEGTTILAAAVIDDVLGIICLAIVMGIVGAASSGTGTVAWGSIGIIALKSFGIWLGITAVGLIFAHKIAQFLKLFLPSATFSILAFGLALLLAGAFEQCGLAMIVGAYVMGLCLSKTDIAFSIQRNLHGIYGFLVPIFFVVMGMLVDVRVFTSTTVLKFGLIYSIIAIAAKIVGCAVPAFFMNFNMLGSLRIGMGMIPRGEVALIIAGIGTTTMMTLNGQKVPVINSELFGIAIIMTLLTTVAAPPLLAFTLGVKAKGVRQEKDDGESVLTVYNLPTDAIRDFVLRIMLENFHREGFRNSEVDRDGGITNFRRENTTFSLIREGNTLTFESSTMEVSIIKAVMYETFVEIHHAMTELKQLAAPESMEKIATDDAVDMPAKNMPIPLEKILSSKAIVTDLKSTDYKGAIKELVAVLESTGTLKDSKMCEEDVFEREATVSTCIPGGIALPHARTDGTGKLVAAIGISKNGCTGSDNSKINVFVLSLCPKTTNQPYLQFIAKVAGTLSKQDKIEAIKNASDPEQVLKIFVG